MKNLSVLLVRGLAVALIALPLMAQAPADPADRAHTNVRVAPGPRTPGAPTGILPVELKAAYGFNQIRNLGAGTTIAVIDAYVDPNITSDLQFYANYFHIQPCNFTVVQLGSNPAQDNWDLEQSLDVEQVCALAPQANIVLINAVSGGFTDLLNAVAVASQPPYNAQVVPMSWTIGDSPADMHYDSYFCNIVNGNGQAVTFVSGSGDSGNQGGPGYPSSSPCVVAAGGTSLALRTATPLPNPLDLNYGMEAAWSGSGGGISRYDSEPSWQQAACAPFSPNGHRCVPDIASDADPSTGVPVYDTYSAGGWIELAGTSLATPDWAAFFTLVNSQRITNGSPVLSQAAQDLYTPYYNSSEYADDFHDITTGSNGNCGLDCNAGTGYDLITGIGTYKANKLYAPMVAMPN